MIEVTEVVMSVQIEVGDDPSALTRARSPTDTNTLSDLEEELVCTRCDEMMGPCKLDHSEEEEETVQSMLLEGPDMIDEEEATSKFEISHISCIKFDTWNLLPTQSSFTSTLDVPPPPAVLLSTPHMTFTPSTLYTMPPIVSQCHLDFTMDYEGQEAIRNEHFHRGKRETKIRN